MIDPQQLRAALGSLEDLGPVNMSRSHLYQLRDAARLALAVLEGGEEIEWCEVHNREWDREVPTRQCRMVPSLRVPLSALRDVDPNEEE